MLAAAGCWVHAAYVHNDDEGNVNVYHRRVYVGAPLANVSCNQGVDPTDLDTFVTDYSAGSGNADMDANGVVDATDVAVFMNSYNAASP